MTPHGMQGLEDGFGELHDEKTTRRWRLVEDGGGCASATSTNLHSPPPTSTVLFVSQRFYRIEPGGPTGRVEPEAHPGQRRGAERDDDRPERHVGGDRGETRDRERDAAAHQHPGRAAHQRQGRRLDEELPQDSAARRAERIEDPDLPRALGDRDHHDRYYTNDPNHQPDR